MVLTGEVQEFDELRADATGWRGLLDGLRFILEQLPIEVQVLQVKEKFGGLRVYVGTPLDANDVKSEELGQRVDELVDAAERVSFMLCYLCGAGATHRGSGFWVRYFCPEHDTDDLASARGKSR